MEITQFVNPYTGGTEAVASYRTIVKTRKAAFAREHPLPDRKVNPVGFETALGSRIAWYLRDRGIVNTSQQNALRDRALAEWKKNDKVNIWLIVKRISAPRIKLNKILQAMHEQGRHKYIEMMFVSDGFVFITGMKEWREYVRQFPTDEATYKWAESFLRNNKGNDIDTVTRSMKAYAIQVPAPVPPDQIVNVDVGRMTSDKPGTVSLTDRLAELKANPDSDRLDDWFPRDKQEDKTVIAPASDKIACPSCEGKGEDEIGQKCTVCNGDGWMYKNEVDPPTQPTKPNHKKPCKNDWLTDAEKQRKFYALAGEIYDDHAVPSKERGAITHRAAGGVTTLYDYAGTASDLLKAIKAICVAEYPIEAKSNEKATPSPDNIETPPTTPNTTEAPISSAQNIAGNDKPVDSSKSEVEALVPSPLLNELKTLTGISVTKIQWYINRKHDPKCYKKIKARNGDDHWTDLDPVAVRKRLDRVFGFQGLGWRIVPAHNGGQVTCTPYMQKTSKGEREMYAVTMNAYVLEYALVDGTGKIVYVQTSAFSDGDVNDDMGYAHRGAFTSLMKQALKMLGGYDHFMDKASGQ